MELRKPSKCVLKAFLIPQIAFWNSHGLPWRELVSERRPQLQSVDGNSYRYPSKLASRKEFIHETVKVVKSTLFGQGYVFFVVVCLLCTQKLSYTQFWTTVNLYIAWQAASLCIAVSHRLDKGRLVLFLVCCFFNQQWSEQAAVNTCQCLHRIRLNSKIRSKSDLGAVQLRWGGQMRVPRNDLKFWSQRIDMEYE